VTVDDHRRAEATCPKCDTHTTYVLPERLRESPLKAVIARAHRDGQAMPTKVDRTPGAIAIQCPSCSAALPAKSESKFVTCEFCKTTSRIPDRTWFELSGKAPEPESMWFLYRGRSQYRTSAEEREQRKHDDAEAAKKKEAREAEKQAQEKRAEDKRKAKRKKLHAEKKALEEEKRAAKDRSDARVAVILGIIFALMVGTCAVGECYDRTHPVKEPTPAH
jgi:hypothetical protein